MRRSFSRLGLQNVEISTRKENAFTNRKSLLLSINLLEICVVLSKMVFVMNLRYPPRSAAVETGTEIAIVSVTVLMTDIRVPQRRNVAAEAGLVAEEAAGIMSLASYAVDKAVVVVVVVVAAAVVVFVTVEQHQFCPQDDLMGIPPHV